MRFKDFCWVLGVFLCLSCEREYKENYKVLPSEDQTYQTLMDSLAPLHSALVAPQEGDWLMSHPENGQSFAKYINLIPKGPTATRNVFYLAKLSDLDSIQQQMFDKTKEYLSIFYQCEVKELTIEVDYEAIPEKYFRYNDKEEIQVLTDFFLKKLLLDHLPDDGMALLGCTTYDIFPDPKWNYVFGQANLNNRVGVWSMRRLGDPVRYPEMKDKAMLRNLKIASHESGHIFSMKHCIYYDCVMNGSAHIGETDNKPVYLCPICLAKMQFTHGFDCNQRNDSLFQFWTDNKLSIYHQYYEIVKEMKLGVE